MKAILTLITTTTVLFGAVIGLNAQSPYTDPAIPTPSVAPRLTLDQLPSPVRDTVRKEAAGKQIATVSARGD